MPRSYSDKFLRELEQHDGNSLGVTLARRCVEANLPATYVAIALGTTPTTVFSWFRGQGIREKTRRTVEVFIELLDADTKNGRLPARNMADAKAYIEEMIGIEI
jgi:hypothetical protein